MWGGKHSDRTRIMAKRKASKPASKSKPGKPAAAGDSVYQLKITLMGTSPPIWRRFQLRDMTLAELHPVIQAVMGWEDGHLHMFDFRDRQFSAPYPGSDFEDEGTVTFMEVLGRKKLFGYEYDFGDSWIHRIEVEKKLDPEADVTYPRCVEGKRACPPEDCGGVWGYADLLEALARPKTARHRELLEWLGGSFDPDKFDVAEANERLAESRRPRRGGWGWDPA
jgi:hypothetical protein